MRGAFWRRDSVCVCSLGPLEEFGVFKISGWVGYCNLERGGSVRGRFRPG